MKAIILAAGRCSRLKPHTDDMPKCLLDINGKNILGRQLEMLKCNGVNDVYITVGYRNNMVRDYVRREYGDMNIAFFENNEYGHTDNGYSLQLALENTEDSPALILNSDVVCHPDVISTLLNSVSRNCLAVQRKNVVIPEDMKVLACESGRVIRVSKQLEQSLGEFTGIAKFETAGRILLTELKEAGKKEWFEKAIDQMLEKVEVMMVDVTHFPSLEIDFPSDLEEARDLFIWGYPEWEFGIRHKSIELCQRNIDDCFRLLRDFVFALNNKGITYWINWGTLLGLYRDGNLIPWDDDIDVTIHFKDLSKLDQLVIPHMQKLGCFVPRIEKCNYNDRWFIRDKERIELNCVVPVDNRYVYEQEGQDLACPKEHIDNLNILEWRGLALNIPTNIEQYLELFYGSSWRIPLRGVKAASL